MAQDTLWELVSKHIRKTAADQYGMASCFTCGKRMRYQQLEAGHFVGRYHGATKYHLDNLRPQCYDCNHAKGGNLQVFRERLIKEIGTERVENLESLCRTVSKLSNRDRQEQISHYKQLVK